MAIVNVTKAECFVETTPVGITFASGSPTDGNTVDYTGEDEKTIILFNNTGQSAGTCQIIKGDGIQGVADITVAVPVGVSVMVLESGAFKKLTGTNKGKVLLKPSASTITVGSVEVR